MGLCCECSSVVVRQREFLVGPGLTTRRVPRLPHHSSSGAFSLSSSKFCYRNLDQLQPHARSRLVPLYHHAYCPRPIADAAQSFCASAAKMATTSNMFLYSLTVQQPTNITLAVLGQFSGTKEQQIMTASGSRLTLWRPDPAQGKVVTMLSHDVFGIIRSIAPFRLAGSNKGKPISHFPQPPRCLASCSDSRKLSCPECVEPRGKKTLDEQSLLNRLR